MNKKLTMICIIMMMTCVFTACGEKDDVKVIEKPAASSQESSSAIQGSTDSGNVNGENVPQEQAGVADGVDADSAGYFFEAEGTSGKVKIVTDIEVSDILEALGEPLSYFEAASCAFEGLDKMYTYDHFEIDTYPDGDKDYISSIILLDDMITTPEGVYVGMTKGDMEAAYGTEYEVIAGTYVYTQGNTHLSFVMKNDEIVSITYTSSVLDQID